MSEGVDARTPCATTVRMCLLTGRLTFLLTMQALLGITLVDGLETTAGAARALIETEATVAHWAIVSDFGHVYKSSKLSNGVSQWRLQLV